MMGIESGAAHNLLQMNGMPVDSYDNVRTFAIPNMNLNVLAIWPVEGG